MRDTVDQQNVHTGSSFCDFLEEQGIREEVEKAAKRQVLAWQRQQTEDSGDPPLDLGEP
jgi:hypothetical protein